eukprot:3346548-Rhodomonas_salina.1
MWHAESSTETGHGPMQCASAVLSEGMSRWYRARVRCYAFAMQSAAAMMHQLRLEETVCGTERAYVLRMWYTQSSTEMEYGATVVVHEEQY